jgi:hypothetical protein
MGMRLLAHLRKRRTEVEKCRSGAPRGAPAPVRAGHLRRLPEMGPIARRTTGCGGFRTSACRRSAPSLLSGAEKDKGAPAPFNRAGEALAV